MNRRLATPVVTPVVTGVLVWVLARWMFHESYLSSTVMALIGAVASLAAHAVARGQRHQPSPGVLDDAETRLLEQGREVDAVKHYRHRTGASLLAARDAVQGRTA